MFKKTHTHKPRNQHKTQLVLKACALKKMFSSAENTIPIKIKRFLSCAEPWYLTQEPIASQKSTSELIYCMVQKLICRCKVNVACRAEGGSSIQGRLMPLEMHQKQHLWADVGASARRADIAPCPLVISSHLFPVFATISYCRCPCVSEALPAPWTWTGSSPRPGTVGGPKPDGALQNGCAGKDCTASLPQWWKDSENRPRVPARLKIHVHATFTGLLWSSG